MTVSPTRSTHGGSSPLARGLRVAVDDQGPRAGIIPARAGFTRRSSNTSSTTPDHPRSRGVYFQLALTVTDVVGSSPLARGLQGTTKTFSPGQRIIPARAGFTSKSPGPRSAMQDHPRSRGGYTTISRTSPGVAGSSPLARGLRCSSSSCTAGARIIPARAGFTRRHRRRHAERPDHPRSRGVYRTMGIRSRMWIGSSPLARGLLAVRPRPTRHSRIIPARAGFTTEPECTCP